MKRLTIIFFTLTTTAVIAFGFTNTDQSNQNTESDLYEFVCPNIDTTKEIFDAQVLGANPLLFEQNLRFFVLGDYKHPVTQKKIHKAQSIADLMDDYPSDWISEYKSVEISTTSNLKVVKFRSPSDRLSIQQKSMLESIAIGSNLTIEVNYKATNSVSGIIEDRVLNKILTVIPETEASYIGGYDVMIDYIKEKCSDVISGRMLLQTESASVIFTVNELGVIEDVKLMRITEDEGINKLLIEVISDMPKWKPAKNAEGKAVKQKFEFIVGFGDKC